MPSDPPFREASGEGGLMRIDGSIRYGSANPVAGPKAWRAHDQRWLEALCVFSLAVLALLALFWPTVRFMVETWWNVTTYGHGVVIFPISGYLVWRKRGSLSELTPRPQPLGLLLVAGAAFAWLLGDFAGITLLTQVAWIGMIQALVLSVYGWPITSRVLFPLLFLFFAVPFGNFLIPYLQDLTAQFVAAALRVTGIPVYRDALYMHIPTGSFFVAEACAGVRFLISTIVLGALIAHVGFTTWWRRTLVLAVAAALPVFANIVRVYGIVMIAYFSDHQLAVDADHLVYGWVFFALVTLSFLAITLVFQERGALRETSAEPSRPAPSQPLRSKGGGTLGLASAAAAVILLAAAAPVYSHVVTRGERAAPLAWQPDTGAWTLATTHPDWRPQFRGADEEIFRTYEAHSGGPVDVYLAVYGSQRHGKEIINEMNSFADGERWTTIGGGGVLAVVGDKSVPIRYARLSSSRAKRLVWYWYWIDGSLTADPILAKLYEARAKLMGGSGAAAVVAVAADYQDQPEAAERTLADFLRHLGSLKAALNEALL
jgi:exosortase A